MKFDKSAKVLTNFRDRFAFTQVLLSDSVGFQNGQMISNSERGQSALSPETISKILKLIRPHSRTAWKAKFRAAYIHDVTQSWNERYYS